MKSVTRPPAGARQLQDSLVAAMESAEMIGYQVVGPGWRSAFVNFPLSEPGVAYTWTGAWQDDDPGDARSADITVATGHVSDADLLRYQLNPPGPGAGRQRYQMIPSVPLAPPTEVSFVDGVAEVTLREARPGQSAVTELVDGETLILIAARRGERVVRIAPVTDRSPLIAGWLAFAACGTR